MAANASQFGLKFQWAPTLGGECYALVKAYLLLATAFQWAPTLGGECYRNLVGVLEPIVYDSFNGHPPLGVNATV